jgi:hypothetical protein
VLHEDVAAEFSALLPMQGESQCIAWMFGWLLLFCDVSK